ncbi:hypothetical protein OG723_43940 (plasmid) [Streptomyces sp. NBC_01278]|uniref:hypothetical protein n=1 Tax=unclassified Streptomyces TaxID=2593676 RepID=UPI002E317B95|nr:hypothetical protein [Streptomyces sp. NBC_01278]
MTRSEFKFAYLQPLFADVERLRGEGAYRQLPAPQPSSSLATDDAPLGMYSASTLIRNSYSAGVAHADALRRLVHAGEVDPQSPWTLMRGALENFATAVWILGGNDRTERRRRTLALWREDMRNRAQHEEDTGHQPGPGGKTGRERRQDIADLALSLGIPTAVLSKPEAGKVIEEAAEDAGLKAREVTAAWRAASGFAHGRYWPNLRASMPIDAVRSGPDHYLMALVIDEDQHRPLTRHTRTLLHRLHDRYQVRATAH